MEEAKIPQHIAIIMDGNGRWAKKRMLPRNAGHVQGSKIVEEICKAANDFGVKYLTLYAFSTENWSRPESEVSALMKLLNSYLSDCLLKAKRNNMRVRVIGDISVLEESMQKKIEELEEVSKDYTGLNLQVAINYGGRDEIVRTSRKLAQACLDGDLKPEDITEKIFAGQMDTCDIPDPELMIRTGGEERLSNYLLWQLAYAEFYFTPVLWPDFNKAELERAIKYFQGVDRRFGGVK